VKGVCRYNTPPNSVTTWAKSIFLFSLLQIKGRVFHLPGGHLPQATSPVSASSPFSLQTLHALSVELRSNRIYKFTTFPVKKIVREEIYLANLKKHRLKEAHRNPIEYHVSFSNWPPS
jgi:hypothetical protein